MDLAGAMKTLRFRGNVAPIGGKARYGGKRPNKSLQATFDPPPTFATAKAGAASNAPELRRWATLWRDRHEV